MKIKTKEQALRVIEIEYQLIQAKKSRLSRRNRERVVQLYEERNPKKEPTQQGS